MLNKVIKKIFRTKNNFSYKRIDINEKEIDFNSEEIKIINLLNYTKKSGKTYSGELYNSGYHTLNLGDKTLVGQRNPNERFNNIPFDFKGKSVLDIGSNQGGMLHAIANDISYGIGIDFDSKMVNVSNRIKTHLNNSHLHFYVFDLENENFDYLKDFILSDKVDICFLLSVCMWLKNWKELISFCNDISNNLLFETNGSEDQQKEQMEYLKHIYKSVKLINDISDDDPLQKKRKLLICSN